MKKVGLLLAIILILPIVSAVDIIPSKEVYYPGETLQAEILGNFVPSLQPENVGVYKRQAVHKTPGDTSLIKSGDKYLFYSTLPLITGNYSIEIRDAEYIEGTGTSEVDVIINFTIEDTNESYLGINPGQLSTTDNFTIAVKAYNAAADVTAKFEATGQSETKTILEGFEKTFKFSIDPIKKFTKSSVTIGSYSIPILVSPSIDEDDDDGIRLSAFLEFRPNKIDATVLRRDSYFFDFILENVGEETLENLFVTSKETLDITPSF